MLQETKRHESEISDTTWASVNQHLTSHTFNLRSGGTGTRAMTTAINNNIFSTITSENTGGGAAHNHGHNLSGSMSGAPALSGSVAINVQYVDFIIANKD